MKHLLIVAFTALFFCKASAQKPSEVIHLTKLKEVSKHIGDSISICAVISQRELNESTNTAILYLGGKYPNHLFKITLKGSKEAKLWPGYVADFGIYVTGRVFGVDGKPEMLITKKEQLGTCGQIVK